jgi:7-cyano-7-deazaguanine reductase
VSEESSHANKGGQFQSLQDRGQNVFTGLETFDLDETVTAVKMSSNEFTAMCPVTGQPDYYTVDIGFMAEKGIESKSLKLYLQQFRDRGAFCEALCAEICKDIYEATDGFHVTVDLYQKSRGGVEIHATATIPESFR